MYGGFCTMQYVDSLLKNLITLTQHDIKYSWQFLINESLIQRARNTLVHEFMRYKQLTHLMFIDSDIDFPDDSSILKLINADKPVIAGLYPKKDLTKTLVVNINKQDTIEHVGTGFLLIKREVLEQLEPQLDKYYPSPKDSQELITEYFKVDIDKSTKLLLSEDWWFCQLCTKNNIPISVDLSIVLRHVGSFEYIGPLERGNQYKQTHTS
jgi:hypothetical protein